MAAKSTTTTTAAAAAEAAEAIVDDRVEIFVPRGAANEDQNLYISVNGKNYLLPRGKASRVPYHVAAEYHRSVAAQAALDARIDAMSND